MVSVPSVAVAGSGVPPPLPPVICLELDELLGPSVLPTGVSGASLGFAGATVVSVGLLGSFELIGPLVLPPGLPSEPPPVEASEKEMSAKLDEGGWRVRG